MSRQGSAGIFSNYAICVPNKSIPILLLAFARGLGQCRPGMQITVHTVADEILTLDAVPGQTLAQALWLSGGLPAPPLCSGLGRCGRCRVRFIRHAPMPVPEDGLALGPAELDRGWRLACRHLLHARTPDMEVELPAPPAPRRCLDAVVSGAPLRLAVDLGTTSLHWRALTPDGATAAHGEELNPQMGAGSDVMSRLATAARPGGEARLAALVRAALQRIVAELPGPVTELCVAANTAMTAILLEKDISGLTAAPYRLDYTGHTVETLAGLPPIYVPPLPSPFVGGDVSAGLIAVEERHRPGYPFLLADLGTNGEFVLAVAPNKAFLASVPLGPALEGIGLTFGDMAGPGAVTAFVLTPSGLAPTVREGASPQRICGTGYLSLVHVLLRAGLLTPEGNFVYAPSSPLGGRLASLLTDVQHEPRLILPGGLYLTARDVEEILKVKAAFSLALERLLRAAGCAAAELRHIFLAGALGEHVVPADLERLGFLPPGAGARLICVGNSSLDGAQLLLEQPSRRDCLERRSAGCVALDLTADPSFTAEYMRHMRFDYDTPLP